MRGFTSALYKGLRLSRDLNAVSRGPRAIRKRIERRILGRLFSRLINRMVGR